MTSLYTGVKELILDVKDLSSFYLGEYPLENMHSNEYLLIYDNNKHCIDKYKWDGTKLVKLKIKSINNQYIGKVKPLNEYQECMVDMILDDSITVKSSMGIPGGGKSYLFVAYGMDMVLKNQFDRLIYIKNNVDIGHEKIGAIPGDLSDKLEPWTKVLYDIFGGKLIVDEFKFKGKIETEYLGYTVGRTYNNTFIVVDDAQQLSKKHVYNLTTRLGHNSVIGFAGDLYQTYSSKYENGNNGMNFLHEKLKNEDFFATVHTKKSERSCTAQKCAELLFEGAVKED